MGPITGSRSRRRDVGSSRPPNLPTARQKRPCPVSVTFRAGRSGCSRCRRARRSAPLVRPDVARHARWRRPYATARCRRVQDLLHRVASTYPAQPDLGLVRFELQADCFAGVWAKHATEPGPDGSPALVSEITTDDFDRALDAAGRIGDDWIQKNLGGGTVQQGHPRHFCAAPQVADHRLPDRRPERLRRVQHERPRLRPRRTSAGIDVATRARA